MLTIEQGGIKGLTPFVKRGLSWVSVRQDYVWGKIDGVWKRGTYQDVTVLLDPPVPTVYWDMNIWEQLGRPDSPMKVTVIIGKNAILAGSLHPTDPRASLDLSGGWALETTFKVQLAGVLLGASGWGGEPFLINPSTLDINSRTTAEYHAASVMRNPLPAWVEKYIPNGPFYAFELTGYTGNFYGQIFPSKKGGPGGDCLRTNRPTAVELVETDDSIGAMLAGGGGGAALNSYWRRFNGTIYVKIAGLAASAAVTKQFSLAGGGGGLGSGATLTLGLAGPPGHPYKFSYGPTGPTHAASADPMFAHQHGRATPAFNRVGVPERNYDGHAPALPTFAAHNYPTLSASTGKEDGSDIFFGTVAEIVNSKAALANDVESSSVTTTRGAKLLIPTGGWYVNYAPLDSVAYMGSTADPSGVLTYATDADSKRKLSYLQPYFLAERGFRSLRLRDRWNAAGGSNVTGTITRHNYAGPTVTTTNVTMNRLFDGLSVLLLDTGIGGMPGMPGRAPKVANGIDWTGQWSQGTTASIKKWNDPRLFGFSFFLLGAKTAGEGGEGGYAITGSEYVTLTGRKIRTQYDTDTLVHVSNFQGRSRPFI